MLGTDTERLIQPLLLNASIFSPISTKSNLP